MTLFRQPEFHDNGRPTLCFRCFDENCGKMDSHGLRIFRFMTMDINICANLLPLASEEAKNLIKDGMTAYPPFGLIAEEAQKAICV